MFPFNSIFWCKWVNIILGERLVKLLNSPHPSPNFSEALTLFLQQIPTESLERRKVPGDTSDLTNSNTSIFLMSLTTVELQWLKHWWLVYHGFFKLVFGFFKLVFESLGKNPIAADLGQSRVILFFIMKMVYCVCSLESPRWGDSNENTQHTLMLEKLEKISLLGILSWHYE